MRRFVVVAVLVPSLAHAELSELERNVIIGTVASAAAAYGVVSTIFMLDDLLKQGYSPPIHTVPAGFLAFASLAASTALLVGWSRASDEVGIAGGSMAAGASLVMCFFVVLSAHGWWIRQPPPLPD